MVENESPTENSKSKAIILAPNSPFLSSPFPPLFSLPWKPNPVPIHPLIHDLHNSISATGTEFLKGLHSFASRNPITEKFLSVSSDLQNFRNEIVSRRNECRRRVNFQLSKHNFAAVLPGDSVAGMAGLVVANGVLNFLNIYNALLIGRLVLTWFPQAPPVIVNPLSTICDPYLNIFRGIIPPIGGTLDLSPILAFLVLDAITSTASALPAELPKPGESPPTTSKNKWMRRLQGSQSKTSNGAN